jgi:hypothetical protein
LFGFPERTYVHLLDVWLSLAQVWLVWLTYIRTFARLSLAQVWLVWLTYIRAFARLSLAQVWLVSLSLALLLQ